MKTLKFISMLAAGMMILNGCEKDDSSSCGSHDDSDEMQQASQGAPGVVYTMDNEVAGNDVLVFARSPQGMLTNTGNTYSTGGTGTDMGLGSQGSIVREEGNLYVVNAGSNSFSVFDIMGLELALLSTTPSEGTMPISITVHNNLVYVLNAGGSGNISGFMMDPAGTFTPIANSTQPLSSAAAGPAQIEFNEDGTYLVVTEKMTNMITIYPVDVNGVAGAGTSFSSAGETPFGFAFGKNNTLIVSEAFGGAPGASAMSSYMLNANGTLTLISGSVPTHQTAACWVVVTNSGRYTYTTNTGSASISGYSVSNTGALALLDADGVTGVTESEPIDMALSQNSKFLYNLNAMSHSISIFSVANDGSLTSIGTVSGLPETSVGMAAK